MLMSDSTVIQVILQQMSPPARTGTFLAEGMDATQFCLRGFPAYIHVSKLKENMALRAKPAYVGI